MHRSPADRERRNALHDIPSTAPLHAADHRSADARRTHLEALSAALTTATDFQVSLVGPLACASLTLRVVNPRSGHLTEAITCDFRDGRWSFVWSWGNAVGPADDVENAVKAIRHVLTPRM